MLLEKTNVFKQDVLTITEFIEKYHEGLTPQAVKYAMESDNLDYVKIGSVYLVVLTEKTLSYTPNNNKNRETTMEV